MAEAPPPCTAAPVSDPTGRVFRMKLLGMETYVVADPEALRPLLSDDGAHFAIPIASFNWLMESLSVQNSKQTHGPWRKLHMAALTGGGLKALLPAVRRIMEDHVQQWASSGRVGIFEEARRMGLDLSIFAITGVDLEGKIDMRWFKEQMYLFLGGLYGLPFALPGTKLAKGLAAKKRLLGALMPLLKERHEAFHAEWEAAGGDPAKVAAKLMDESEEPITVHKAQMMGFHSIGAGTLRGTAMSVLHSVMAAADTTRFALFNTWALLAQLPAVQDKIYEEQQKVVSELGPELSFQALSRMPYLDAVFKEALRVLPPSSGGFRKLTRDATICGVTLPAGTLIWYHALLLQILDPVLWDGDTSVDLPPHMDWQNNLEAAFQPERWMGDETQRPRSFYVFGWGSHLCAGTNLVQMEVKLLLALVMRRFRLELEMPDMLTRAELFPYVVPVKGTDGMRLVPREESLPWN
ncbi:hypothetical protein VOLCADRAFT_106263 [Volvox carteri f. nagariensis]|uniref:Cytochrome P450 n=1 Tax=Volvox carteri f. nagariensis TaxID=3068 RepID=D8U680_VOLCA|nr:uncharacterized protein VOLCADRAFT_106263 [Volvox carteri f. nagariensis]EFJ44894.1 hypothetical protein VOLCADRAFT_106263 [Volvox carteri f. nagariensis]|eukprot:XP_002954177.1 hypothetical protein VOLCADRAFT_106263 [Volvox carteri f. nagariensis]